MADADALRDATIPGVPVTPEPAPPPAAAPPDGSVMSLVDHLGELRDRLFRVILAVVAGSAVGFYLSERVRNLLLDLIPDGTAQTLGPGDGFAITLRIALITGVILAMPVILYQLWAFVAPGLTPAERKTVRPWVPLALFFFALGVGIAYLVLPFALAFLFSFNDDRLVENLVLDIVADVGNLLEPAGNLPDIRPEPLFLEPRERRAALILLREEIVSHAVGGETGVGCRHHWLLSTIVIVSGLGASG